jgi:hypothetical protein
MSKKTLIILLTAAFIVLLALFLIIDKGEVKFKKSEKEPLFGNFSGTNVSFIKIYFRDYYEREKTFDYTLFRSNDYWYISYSNIVDRVDPKLGDFLANILADIEKLETLSNDLPLDPMKTFGLNNPNAIIVFDINKKTNKITVGNLTPTKDYYYSIVNDSTNAFYLIYAYKLDNLLKYPYDTRDKNIFTREWITNITGIEYKPINSNVVFVFTNKNKSWYSLSPTEKELDSVYIENSFLKDLRSLNISFFVDDKRKREKLLKTSPEGYIKLFNPTNTFLLSVLKVEGKNIYCYDPQRDSVFAIDYESSHYLFTSPLERFLKITNK